MDELGLVVHSETAGDIGFVTLRKCDLFAPFMEGDSGRVPSLLSLAVKFEPSIPDRKLQRNFLMEEESPLLRITFTICTFYPPYKHDLQFSSISNSVPRFHHRFCVIRRHKTATGTHS